MATLAQKASVTNRNKYIIAASFIFAFVFGIRYGVGRDYPAYLTNYVSYLKLGYSDSQDEFGFDFLQQLFSYFHFHPTFFFGFIAFLEIFLFYNVFRDKKYLYHSFTLIFILSAAWLAFSSGLRQALAFCFFLLALEYASKKDFLKYFFWLFIAFSIHKSAAILVVFYPFFLYKKEWFKKPWVELLVYWVSVLFMLSHVFESLLMNLDSQIQVIATLLSYDSYLQEQYADVLYTRENGIGLGQLVYILLYSVFIVNSKKVKHYFRDEYFSKAYDLFFIGAVLKCLFNGSNLFGRVIWYFEYFYLIVGAFTLLYLYQRNKRWYYVTLSLIVLIFVAVLYKGDINFANYYFWWEKSQFEADHAGNVIKVVL